MENNSTTKTTAKITYASSGDFTGIAFVDNYLKLAGNDASNKTDKIASLGSCTNSCTDKSGYTCVIKCTKVSGATEGGWYILQEIYLQLLLLLVFFQLKQIKMIILI